MRRAIGVAFHRDGRHCDRRKRLGLAQGEAKYDDLEKRLATSGPLPAYGCYRESIPAMLVYRGADALMEFLFCDRNHTRGINATRVVGLAVSLVRRNSRLVVLGIVFVSEHVGGPDNIRPSAKTRRECRKQRMRGQARFSMVREALTAHFDVDRAITDILQRYQQFALLGAWAIPRYFKDENHRLVGRRKSIFSSRCAAQLFARLSELCERILQT